MSFPRFIPHLLAAILALSPPVRAEEEERSPWLGPRHEERAVLGIEGLREEGDGLRGLRVVFGMWDERGGLELRTLFYTTVLEQGPLLVFRTGLDVGLLGFGYGPFRILPHVAIGPEYRDEEPHSGVGGTLAVGIEGAVWIGRSAQIAVAFDRKWGFPSTTRNELSVGLRWTPKELPWWDVGADEESQ